MKKIQTIIKQFGNTDEACVYEVAAHEEKIVVFVINAKKDIHVSIRIALTGPGSAAAIYGIVFPHRGSTVTLETHQDHHCPDTKSMLLVKSVMSDHTQFHFYGNIRIASGARHADAYQKNMNLLVGSDTHVESQPMLEILHHDVTCSHGVWTSPIPEEPIWYMKTRGIEEQEAKNLYIHGFLDEILTHISSKKIHDMMDNQVSHI